MVRFIKTLRKDIIDTASDRGFANLSDGAPAVIGYTFMTHVPREPVGDVLVDPRPTFTRYSRTEKADVKRSLKAWTDVADITFVEVAEGKADLFIGQHAMPYGIDGYAGGITTDLENGSLRPNTLWLDNGGFVSTARGHRVITHEIGHVIGLRHPYVGATGLREGEAKLSIMSYDHAGNSFRPGIFDIAAVQSIYGPAQRKLGANSYELGRTKLIWDGGGIDTISAAKAKAKVHLDLNDGTWSWIGHKALSLLDKGQSWLGHYTQIENAVRSKHNDVIIGNELDNMIQGGKGDDTIIGGDGADVLYGGPGNDTFRFSKTGELGTMSSHDAIMDFSEGDKVDLRGLGLIYRGNADDDAVLSVSHAGQSYYNPGNHELRIDINGDALPDAVLHLTMQSLSAASLIL